MLVGTEQVGDMGDIQVMIQLVSGQAEFASAPSQCFQAGGMTRISSALGVFVDHPSRTVYRTD
jgi:hypothetical protein